MTLERAFVFGFYACFQNAGIIRVYVVASVFGMVDPTLPFVPGLWFVLSPLYVNGTFCNSLCIRFLSTVLLSAGP